MQMIASQPVTIANGASLSNAVELRGAQLCQIEMPAAWTAANLTFQTSANGVTYQDLYTEAGAEVTVTAAAARNISLDPVISGVKYLKVRSGTTATPVNQAADRIIILNLWE